MALIDFNDWKKTYVPAYKSWAADAAARDVAAPGMLKLSQGWTIEKPKHTTFNWYQNRTDNRLLDLEAMVAWLFYALKEKGITNG